ncbi:hypothetical protein AGOR_G00194820 [Albula goreensis]|uniref:Ig-like domain-containing protein n=1 Tax=Albula goreensis TaxID=1534307 RepID=A0A8T3CW18_9TELE|nr:hypothetical protein AGOR_G00194820 [Albula goreensis]
MHRQFVHSLPSKEKVLKCIVGDRVSFPSAVRSNVFLNKDNRRVAKVVGEIDVLSSRLRGRLQWDRSTGLFSITDLNRDDSGLFKADYWDGRSSDFIYQLTVYDPVSTPQVSSRNKMKPTCSVLCSVENGREVTLSWQREGETLNSTSSPDLNSPLSLPLEIEENSAPYSCVATNPVSNMTVTVNPEEFCLDPVSTPQVSSRNKMKLTCSVLCSVENGREVTLSWQREGETLYLTSSPDLNTPLSLPLEIEENSAPYSCVATNPVSNKTVTVKPEEFCLDSVSKPRITSTALEGNRGRYCVVLCSVENGREVTLSWQREGETLSHTSSPDLNTPLSLLLKRDDPNSTYSCVATNPVSEKRTDLNTSELCRVDCSDHKGEGMIQSFIYKPVSAPALMLRAIFTQTCTIMMWL